MNKVILMGRLTRDPEIRYSAGAETKAIANFTLAVDRRYKKMVIKPLILLVALPLENLRSLLKSISVKVKRFLLRGIGEQVLMKKMA